MTFVYSTPNCAYCAKAKALLTEKGREFEEVDLTKDEEAKNRVIEATGQRKVPIIEIDGKLIVGFDNLQEYLTASI